MNKDTNPDKSVPTPAVSFQIFVNEDQVVVLRSLDVRMDYCFGSKKTARKAADLIRGDSAYSEYFLGRPCRVDAYCISHLEPEEVF